LSDVVYLYGFVPSSANAPAADVSGIAERAVELVGVADFQAAISMVPSAEYSTERIEARLQDLAWVAAQGLAHERIVAWFVDRAQIVPVPLFTLYTNTDTLVSTVWSRAADISAQLRRFDGLREWDLKIGYRAADVARHAAELSDDVREIEDRMATAAPGRRFLLERKRDDLVRGIAPTLARTRADQLLAELRPLVHDCVVLTIPRADHDLPVVLHAALLVPVTREASLTDEIARRAAALDAVGLSVQFSGPWAPYRFLDRDAG
jgi:hypothetical protein